MTNTRTADALVIFGITGDLARKMTFRSLYRLEQRDQLGLPIIGVAVDDFDDEALRQRARESITGSGETLDEKVFGRLAKRLRYGRGDFGSKDTYARVADALGDASNPVFYLEIPPSLFATVVAGLAGAGLVKPVGRGGSPGGGRAARRCGAHATAAIRASSPRGRTLPRESPSRCGPRRRCAAHGRSAGPCVVARA